MVLVLQEHCLDRWFLKAPKAKHFLENIPENKAPFLVIKLRCLRYKMAIPVVHLGLGVHRVLASHKPGKANQLNQQIAAEFLKLFRITNLCKEQDQLLPRYIEITGEPKAKRFAFKCDSDESSDDGGLDLGCAVLKTLFDLHVDGLNS